MSFIGERRHQKEHEKRQQFEPVIADLPSKTHQSCKKESENKVVHNLEFDKIKAEQFEIQPRHKLGEYYHLQIGSEMAEEPFKRKSSLQCIRFKELPLLPERKIDRIAPDHRQLVEIEQNDKQPACPFKRNVRPGYSCDNWSHQVQTRKKDQNCHQSSFADS